MAETILPRSVLARLDPFQAAVEAEAEEAAGRMRDGDVALDAGAGECRHKKHFIRGRYLALDSGRGDPRWDYSRLDVCGDLEHLPFRGGALDRVLCMVVLEHTRRPRAVLAEFARVLRPGGEVFMVVPFLWEEHQAPHDYFRFTRYGIRSLIDDLPFRLDLVEPIGGLFWVCARRCVNLLSVFQGGWRWPVFALLLPFLGFLFPLGLHALDGLDGNKSFSLGFRVRATRRIE